MQNATVGVPVELGTFGGLSTELSPSDLPAGGSPDNSDCAFEPGSVLTRPGLSRLYSNDPEFGVVVYTKSFTTLAGKQFNLKLYATGNLYAENFSDAPGTFTKIGSVPAGSLCKSVDAYGRLFMTFHDGLHGTDIPRSFDGKKYSRVGQSGPCGNPSFSEYVAPSVALGNGASGTVVAVTSLVSADPVEYSGTYYAGPSLGWQEWTRTVYTTLKLTVASVAGLLVGGSISWTGNAALNLSNVTISDISGSIVTVNYQNSLLYSGAGGSLTQAQPNLYRVQNIVTASTATPHGLNPGDMFSVVGVANTVLGGTITSAVRANNIATITTSAVNGIRYGSRVVIASVTDATFNGTWTVTEVISATAFQITSTNLADATSSGGTVSDIWNNTDRFVISAPTATSLIYTEEGPDDQTSGAGNITPVGQVAGGIRHAVCLFQTDFGFITPPSNPIRLSTSGNKKLTISNLPIGPSNVIARILAFTGIDGGKYFYIPVPTRDDNGNLIGTSTVVSDNTSTAAVFDFSDQALLSATAIDIDGNNLFALRILGNASGVGFYADRTFWWGDENYVQNFQNMGFEGGVNANGTPMGWTVTGTGLTVVPNADFGDGINFAVGSAAILSQPASLDYYGNAVLEPNTFYIFKFWASMTGTGSPRVLAQIYDTATSSVLAVANAAVPSSAGFVQGQFSVATPLKVPATAILRVMVTDNANASVTLDELRIIFAANPYVDTKFSVSYIRNPESIDGVTGVLGASADPKPIMDVGLLRDNFYFVTNGPLGKLHTTKNTNVEPSGWDVNEIAARCGSCTMQSMISGESWLSWVSEDGARMFDGSQPQKVTQDIQDRWNLINRNALSSIWAVNDTMQRRIYWGVPLGSSTLTNAVYQMDYRYAETASEIEDRASVRVSPYSGKMLVLELSRKFSPWTIPATAGSFLATSAGIVPAFSDSLGRSYRLDPNKLHDDDYGFIPAYYVTSPFVDGDMEQQLQLGSFRHLYTFMGLFVFGTGKVVIWPLADSLNNVYPSRGPYAMTQDPQALMEIPLNVSGSRVFFKFAAVPQSGSPDAAFSLSRMVVTMSPHPMSPVAGKSF